MGKKIKDYPRARSVFFEWELLNSTAFAKLTRAEIHILIIFYLKRQFSPQKKKGKTVYILANNGKITFTYSEAGKYGFDGTAFTRAIDKLVEVGFIEIAVPSPGFKIKNLFAISERWRAYGNPGYVEAKRQKARNAIGQKSRFRKLKVPGLDGIMGSVTIEFPEEKQNSPAKMRVKKSRITRKNVAT